MANGPKKAEVPRDQTVTLVGIPSAEEFGQPQTQSQFVGVAERDARSAITAITRVADEVLPGGDLWTAEAELLAQARALVNQADAVRSWREKRDAEIAEARAQTAETVAGVV